MRKEIRLLIEGFFDNDIFNSNNINQDIQDIGDQYYDYQVNQFYTQNNVQFLCINNGQNFSDKKPRFLYTENNSIIIKKNKWSKIGGYLEKLGKHDKNYEFGYNDTNIVKTEYYPKSEPAFYECLKLNENCYLPSIKELYYGVLYLLNNNKLPDMPKINFFSSTQKGEQVYGIAVYPYLDVDFNNYITNITTINLFKEKCFNILPFYYPFN